MADILFNERLDDHLYALQDAAGPGEAVVRLAEFERAMERHFEVEETPGGLFSTLLSGGAPADAVARLRFEHGEARRDVEALRQDARSGIDVGPLLLALVERLRDHERREMEWVGAYLHQ